MSPRCVAFPFRAGRLALATLLAALASALAEPVTPARIATRPESERAAWLAYWKDSQRRADTEQAALAAELKSSGLARALPAPAAGDFKLSRKPGDPWFRTPEARQLANVVISYQTPSGGWSKHVNFQAGSRQPGTSWSSQDSPEMPRHYRGTFDNRSTTEELRLLAAVQTAQPMPAVHASFDRGLDYILEAQYPNGGWPQVYPLEGKYHDDITFNDDAMLHVLELLRDIRDQSPEFAFVDSTRRKKSALALAAGVQCVLQAQVVQAGRRSVWCAQHDALTLRPAAARLKEPASLSGVESAGLLRFLMRLPDPLPGKDPAIEAALAWFARSRITGLRETQRDGRQFYEPDARATKIYWARFYDVVTNRPIFAGAQDGIVYHSFEEMWTRNTFGYDYYSSRPLSVVTTEQKKWRRTQSPR